VSRAIANEESSTRVIRRMEIDGLEDRVATLLVMSGHCKGELLSLEVGATTLGRDALCDIVIPDDGISREHCRFHHDGDAVWVEDLGSTNGTWLDRQRITRRVKLESGTRVRLGAGTLLRFVLQSEVDRAYYEELRAAAVRDPLTGVFNKRHLQERLRAELAYATRHSEPLALIIFDVDHFKQINDGYGHAAGDAVLAQLGAVLVTHTRGEDVIARFGGDEFVILARGTDIDGAQRLAERLRQGVARFAFSHDGREIGVTLSIGVAAVAGGQPADDLFNVADAALYEAKARGRDTVVAARCQRGAPL
jgi:diguanylate cyclase (GGDEF)-like protein